MKTIFKPITLRNGPEARLNISK